MQTDVRPDLPFPTPDPPSLVIKPREGAAPHPWNPAPWVHMGVMEVYIKSRRGCRSLLGTLGTQETGQRYRDTSVPLADSRRRQNLAILVNEARQVPLPGYGTRVGRLRRPQLTPLAASLGLL